MMHFSLIEGSLICYPKYLEKSFTRSESKCNKVVKDEAILIRVSREPMMVDLTASELQKEILRALRSTYMHFNYGSY